MYCSEKFLMSTKATILLYPAVHFSPLIKSLLPD